MVAVALAQLAATSVWRRDGDGPGVRRAFLAAAATGAAVAGLVIVAIWTDPGGELFVRVVAATAVLDVFLVMLQPLLRRLRGSDSVTVVLEGTREQIEDALARVEGTGVRVRR